MKNNHLSDINKYHEYYGVCSSEFILLVGAKW